MNEFVESQISEERLENRRSAIEMVNEYKNDPENKNFPKGELLIFLIDKNHHIHRVTAPFLDNIRNNEGMAVSLTFTNPTKPIIINGVPHMFSRTEELESDNNEENSVVLLFEQSEEAAWSIDPDGFCLRMQDPFECGIIGGHKIIGGVKTYKQENGELGYKTVFYKYLNEPSELMNEDGTEVEPFAYGPEKMKDIRIIQLQNGKIGVFTRPQKDKGYGGRGKIAYFEIDSLDQLTDKLEDHARNEDPEEIISGLFLDEEWGGANELHMLEDGRIGVLGHIAHFGKIPNNPEISVKNYYAMSFIFDPATRETSNYKIVCTAEDFDPPVIPKKSDLGSVVFSGGLVRNGDKTAILYCGIGDIKAGAKLIKDPFLS